MKLHRMITLEAQGPVPVGLTLDEIINAGKVTNPYQIYVLGWLSEFFKDGLKSADMELEAPISFESKATHADVVNALKSLAPKEAVALAEYLKDCIKVGECLIHDRHMSIIDWINLVLHAQR